MPISIKEGKQLVSDLARDTLDTSLTGWFVMDRGLTRSGETRRFDVMHRVQFERRDAQKDYRLLTIHVSDEGVCRIADDRREHVASLLAGSLHESVSLAPVRTYEYDEAVRRVFQVLQAYATRPKWFIDLEYVDGKPFEIMALVTMHSKMLKIPVKVFISRRGRVNYFNKMHPRDRECIAWVVVDDDLSNDGIWSTVLTKLGHIRRVRNTHKA